LKKERRQSGGEKKGSGKKTKKDYFAEYYDHREKKK